MTNFMTKLNWPRIGKLACLAAAVALACYQIPDEFYVEIGGKNNGKGERNVGPRR